MQAIQRHAQVRRARLPAFGHVHTMMDLPALLWTLALPIALAGCSLSRRSLFGGRRVISTVVGRSPAPRRHVFGGPSIGILSAGSLCSLNHRRNTADRRALSNDAQDATTSAVCRNSGGRKSQGRNWCGYAAMYVVVVVVGYGVQKSGTYRLYRKR
jgi:hypothetical protein